MNKKYLLILVTTLLIGISLGIAYEKFLSNYVQEQLERIFSKSEPELVGYQGTAKIEAIRAYLFYDHMGTISGDMLAKKDITLWNTIIGEGDAGSPSDSTFVIVEISGRDISATRHAKVNIVVTNSSGKQIANVTRGFSIYDNFRKSYIPLVIPDTGCGHVTVSAKLVGKGFDPSSIAQTIPFECGE
ncbi:hypothetical protein [Polynucleobacter sp. UB-Siik-W21]|uniref:hypothetical protein n=1 Tax=Polynucleobacter sp. UB-Siik-W21 TaxID=1855646 RepID=UPI001BFE9319|nr:hypothetical protein [Polynucleobacter sp. UB-Siik-W21]QWD70389.1 hypothetical protein C2756_10940 [Polynucleobacter sp. UB-Siik-W21]